MILNRFLIFLIPMLLVFIGCSDKPASTDSPKKEKVSYTLSSDLNSADILKAMETVADWQLNNPVRFDVIYKVNGSETTERVKILWDGTLVLKEPRVFEVKEGDYPDAWQYFSNLVKEDVSFCELPDAVQTTITETCDIEPSRIINIQMADKSSKGWEMAVLFMGLMDLSHISSKPYYFSALKEIGEANNWKLGDRIYHADDHCVGQMYLDMYSQLQDKDIYADIKIKFDWIIDQPHGQGIEYKQSKNRWTWSDALFMSPPVWVELSNITGDKKYIDYMDHEWWLVTDHLFDKEENLFYRDERYFSIKENNGEKVFWSRGNGWVLAGLALVLENMPGDYPTRNRYIQLYQKMAAKIVEIQPAGGLWHASLLDTVSYPSPEASSSSLISYALAWGINNGHLSKAEYFPAVEKTWKGLIGCIEPDGKLGWIQLPGGQPDDVSGEKTASYGVGAFLLAGAELEKLVSGTNARE